MLILFPASILDPKSPDEEFLEQYHQFQSMGFTTALYSKDEFLSGRATIRGIVKSKVVLYRGWMLDPEEYSLLCQTIEVAGGSALIPQDMYLATHHLPNWYPLLKEFTPQTIFATESDDLESILSKLNWGSYFVKDFVKSLKTGMGSRLDNAGNVRNLLDSLRQYRGKIEGGICIRQFEEFEAESEKRYFVMNHRPYAAKEIEEIPALVKVAAERIQSSFFSVDLVRRKDGIDRIVEIGDGQVSDIVGWSAKRFAETLRDAFRKT